MAADVPKTSTHDLPKLTHLIQRNALSRNALALPALRAISRAYTAALADFRRSYATTTARSTKPTSTVKKAVKKTAAAKKPAPKKKAAAKKPKKKVTAKKKKAKAKKTTKPKRARKVLTDEEKQKDLIRELRYKALREPILPRVVSAWQAFTAEALSGKAPADQKGARLKDAAARFQNFTPAEKEVGRHACLGTYWVAMDIY